MHSIYIHLNYSGKPELPRRLWFSALRMAPPDDLRLHLHRTHSICFRQSFVSHQPLAHSHRMNSGRKSRGAHFSAQRSLIGVIMQVSSPHTPGSTELQRYHKNLRSRRPTHRTSTLQIPSLLCYPWILTIDNIQLRQSPPPALCPPRDTD